MLAEGVSPERRAIRCPVPGCGAYMGDYSPETTGSVWHDCWKCRARVRFDLPAGRWTVERAPKRR